MKLRNILAALALTSGPALAQDEMVLLLDWFVNPDHGPIIVAQEKGYFAEQDLSVEVIAPADPSDPPKLVAAGKADLAISYQPQLHLQIHEGLPLQRVGTLVATPLNCLLALTDGPIASPTDLAGKKVGFSVGGVEEAVLGAILTHHGLSLDDVELVNVLPPYDELIYVANRDTMDKDMIARFLAATEKATQYIVNHPEESWEVFAATSADLQDELNARAWKDTLPRFALRPTAMDAGRYATFETFLHDAGLIPDISPVSTIAIDVTAR